MQSDKQTEKRIQQLRISTYISEYQSYDCSQQTNKQQKYQSPNVIRKLKILWNKQKYLTDDQHQSSKDINIQFFEQDSSMHNQEEEQLKASQISKQEVIFQRNQRKKHSFQTKRHQRAVSFSDQQQSYPQKMKKTKDKQLIKGIQQISIKEELVELASVSSAFQEQ